MAVLGGFPFFSFFSSQSRSERLCKSIGPLSSVIKRQQISQRAIQNVKKRKTSTSSSSASSVSSTGSEEVVTEYSILNNFPRPNLLPTLQFSFFGYQQQQARTFTQCNNCSGPHSTDFCPC